MTQLTSREHAIICEALVDLMVVTLLTDDDGRSDEIQSLLAKLGQPQPSSSKITWAQQEQLKVSHHPV